MYIHYFMQNTKAPLIPRRSSAHICFIIAMAYTIYAPLPAAFGLLICCKSLEGPAAHLGHVKYSQKLSKKALHFDFFTNIILRHESNRVNLCEERVSSP